MFAGHETPAHDVGVGGETGAAGELFVAEGFDADGVGEGSCCGKMSGLESGGGEGVGEVVGKRGGKGRGSRRNMRDKRVGKRRRGETRV